MSQKTMRVFGNYAKVHKNSGVCDYAREVELGLQQELWIGLKQCGTPTTRALGHFGGPQVIRTQKYSRSPKL